TLSILSTIEDRFGLQPLNQADANASNLASSFQTTPHVSIGMAYLQPDASNIGKNVLVVIGTKQGDDISIGPAQDPSQIEVRIDKAGVDQMFDASQISRIMVYGQGGDDHIQVDPSIALSAMIFGGDGDDHIEAGRGPPLVVGGRGKNQIDGGAGRDLLIGGLGRSQIDTHGNESIVIAGTTNYGEDPEALAAIEAEWARTDEDLATRVANIQKGVGLDSEFK